VADRLSAGPDSAVATVLSVAQQVDAAVAAAGQPGLADALAAHAALARRTDSPASAAVGRVVRGVDAGFALGAEEERRVAAQRPTGATKAALPLGATAPAAPAVTIVRGQHDGLLAAEHVTRGQRYAAPALASRGVITRAAAGAAGLPIGEEVPAPDWVAVPLAVVAAAGRRSVDPTPVARGQGYVDGRHDHRRVGRIERRRNVRRRRRASPAA